MVGVELNKEKINQVFPAYGDYVNKRRIFFFF